MRPDVYTRALLTFIAICLAVLTLRAASLFPEAKAGTSLKCTGELTANAWGGTEASIGGYRVEITCR